MREVFKGFRRTKVAIRYSMGNRSQTPKVSSELILRNW